MSKPRPHAPYREDPMILNIGTLPLFLTSALIAPASSVECPPPASRVLSVEYPPPASRVLSILVLHQRIVVVSKHTRARQQRDLLFECASSKVVSAARRKRPRLANPIQCGVRLRSQFMALPTLRSDHPHCFSVHQNWKDPHPRAYEQSPSGRFALTAPSSLPSP